VNIYRYDLGDFQLFFDIFSGNSGSKFTHHHDSLLSYVIFYKGEEILVDPGKATFLSPSGYHLNFRHNGIWSSKCVLRPVQRFFMPPVFLKNSIGIKIACESNALIIRAENFITGFKKSICIKESCGKIFFSESLESNRALGEVGFSHCFSGMDVSRADLNLYMFKSLIIKYDEAMKDGLVDRAIDYGETERVASLSSHIKAIGRSASVGWSIASER